MTVKVKICGLTNAEDAAAAVEAGADAVGFVFHKKSPRCAETAAVKAIVKELPPFVLPVGVFVNEDAAVAGARAAVDGSRPGGEAPGTGVHGPLMSGAEISVP